MSGTEAKVLCLFLFYVEIRPCAGLSVSSLLPQTRLMHDGWMVSLRLRSLGLRSLFACPLAIAALTQNASAQRVFDVRDYGATGNKSDDARPAIQKAIDACGKVGGGRVYVPPGEYTSGQLHLRSGVRLYLEAGATIYATLDGTQYDDARKAALIYGEDLHDIALEGAGTLDGQASYEWHLNTITDHYILPNQRQMEAAGKPLLRSFPVGQGTETVFPRMVLLLRCVD